MAGGFIPLLYFLILSHFEFIIFSNLGFLLRVPQDGEPFTLSEVEGVEPVLRAYLLRFWCLTFYL